MDSKGPKRCKRHGCLKHYAEEDNGEGQCHFHPGQPIFHDLKKGWTCCNKIVFDWDEFQKLPTCATGIHTDNKDDAQGFFQSGTVKTAATAIKKEEGKAIVINDINKYNDSNPPFRQISRPRRKSRMQASPRRRRRPS